MAEILYAMGEMAETKFGESCHENTQINRDFNSLTSIYI